MFVSIQSNPMQAGRATKPVRSQQTKASKAARPGKRAAAAAAAKQPKQQPAVTEAASLDLWGADATQPGAPVATPHMCDMMRRAQKDRIIILQLRVEMPSTTRYAAGKRERPA